MPRHAGPHNWDTRGCLVCHPLGPRARHHSQTLVYLRITNDTQIPYCCSFKNIYINIIPSGSEILVLLQFFVSEKVRVLRRTFPQGVSGAHKRP